MYIIFALQITNHCIGQEKSDKTGNIGFGLNAGSFISNKIDGFNFFVDLTYNKINQTYNKNKFISSTGPIIGQRWKLDNNFLYTSAQSRGIGLTGLHCITRYFPSPNERTFNYFVQVQSIFQLYSDNDFDNYFNDYYKSHLINLGPFIGVGYKITFLKKLYFTQSVSIGGLYKHLTIDFSNNPDIENENIYFSWTTDLTFGYRFK
jgi:hypothetical protein